MLVDICSAVNGHFEFGEIGSASIRLIPLFWWLLFPEIWAGTFPKVVPTQVNSVLFRHGNRLIPL